MDVTMIQEAMLDSIDNIEMESLYAEYDVLMSLGEMYVKSALIQEANFTAKGPDMAYVGFNAIEDEKKKDPNAGVGDAPLDEDMTKKKSWFKKAIEWVIRALGTLGKAIWSALKFVGKLIAGIPKGVVNMVDGIYKNAKGIARVHVKNKKTKNEAGEEVVTPEITVSLDYDPDKLYEAFTKILNESDVSGVASACATALKKKDFTKRTTLSLEEYNTKLETIKNAIDELRSVLNRFKSAAGIDFEKMNATETQNVENMLAFVAKMNTIVMANALEISEILRKKEERRERKEADKNTRRPKGDEKYVI